VTEVLPIAAETTVLEWKRPFWSGFDVPQAPAARNVNHLLTLTTPSREQTLTILARILLRTA